MLSPWLTSLPLLILVPPFCFELRLRVGPPPRITWVCPSLQPASFDYGAFVIGQLRRHVGSQTFRLPNAYLHLICEILLPQKLDLIIGDDPIIGENLGASQL